MKPNMHYVDELVAFGQIAKRENRYLDAAYLYRNIEGTFTATACVCDEPNQELIVGTGNSPMEAMRNLAREVRLFMQGDYSFTEAMTSVPADAATLNTIDSNWTGIKKN